jgi:peroxiredoxin Q/BCP
MLNIGDKAPEISLPDSNGNIIKLSDFRGKKVVVYFYPRDESPGCTKEACSIRDVYDEILDVTDLEPTVKKVVPKEVPKKNDEFLKALIAFRKNLQ